MARVVITTWGSYGDLFPSIGIGRALADRGHDVRLAVPAYYAPLVRHERLEHHPVGPDIDPGDRDIVARVMDPRRGTEVLIREWLMPRLEQTCEELLRAVQQQCLFEALAGLGVHRSGEAEHRPDLAAERGAGARQPITEPAPEIHALRREKRDQPFGSRPRWPGICKHF